MATIPQTFPQEPTSATINFDFQDIQDGTGTAIVYGSTTADNGTTSYNLSKNINYSNNVSTFVAEGAVGTPIDIDFDIILNTPRDLFGMVRANVGWMAGHSTTANKGSTTYVKMYVRKWNGSTETEIVSTTSSDTLVVGSLSTDSKIVQIQKEVTTPVHFSIGDTLRITIQVIVSAVQNDWTPVALFHDPKARAFSASRDYGTTNAGSATIDTTQLVVNIPFRVND